MSIFDQLNVKPVINACGVYTDLGGVVFSPTVQQAMQDVNRYHVRMVDLLDRSGEQIAKMLGAPAARVVPGASAAIALGTAAVMTGMDGEAWERLPDTTGLRNEVLLQAAHRYKYDRMVRHAGAKTVFVGDGRGTTTAQLEAAIGGRTAAFYYPMHLEGTPGTLSLVEYAAVAHKHNLPVIVDAAYMNFPTHIMHDFLAKGADLVCLSAKYFWGPNSGGVIYGRKDLIDAVAGVDFTRYESGKYLTFGRPFKLDRQTIVGTTVALDEWLKLDHEERWEGYARKVAQIQGALQGVAGISTQPRFFTMDERLIESPVNCLAITLAPGARYTAETLAAALMQTEPMAIAAVPMDDTLVVAMDTVLDGQEAVIAKRLRELLT